ncbi:MAG: hypothetical protein DA408_00400 [Bacteroidetes bacterium]|nr:MAG: hypothetical protein C7N36_19250 [Bacteroidota bacterium]PTM15114.1 MAG: hypothetical protein DA408_00400 [Bacteroidota bacterium]
MLTQIRYSFVLFLAFSLGVNQPLAACSCAEFPSFCTNAVFGRVFLGRVIDHQIGYYDGYEAAYFTTLEVIDPMQSEGLPDTLSMINQDGLNCNASIFDLLPGDSVVISLAFDTYPWPEGYTGIPDYPTFDLFGCGVYHLVVNQGKLGGGTTNMMEVNLLDFLQNSTENCPILLNTTTPLNSYPIKVGPNPVVDNLKLHNQNDRVIRYTLFDLLARPLRQDELPAGQETDIPFSDLPAGTYLLRIQGIKQEYNQLIIK